MLGKGGFGQVYLGYSSDIEADDLDPENLHAIVQRVRELTNRIISRFGGHFSPSTSEAIQIYFGYPIAMEDSARRAVLSGLEIGSEIKKLQARSHVCTWSCRLDVS